MSSKNSPLLSVPTHVITGFLGTGKSSVILQLLKHKPNNERWAVLVNEFGEIGVDGSLFAGQHSTAQGIFIREVPGGCMCCTAGVPMQVALNQLLREAKPDRLFIEPTGLGHPKEVLQTLSEQHYSQVLSLQKTVTLVDARKLLDQRYTEHPIFNQQIAIADVIVGTKADCYQIDDQQRLLDYLKVVGQANAQVLFAKHGDISLSQLQGSTSVTVPPVKHHHHHSVKPTANDMAIPACGFVKAVNSGEGFTSIGWRFSATTVFNYQQIVDFLSALQVERVKAVLNTNAGSFGFNVSDNRLTTTSLQYHQQSRIELIGEGLDESIEIQLMACIISAS